MDPAQNLERRAAAAAALLLALAALDCGGKRPDANPAGADLTFRVTGDLELPGPLAPGGALPLEPAAPGEPVVVDVRAGGRLWRVPLGPDGGWGLPVERETPTAEPAVEAPPPGTTAWAEAPDGRVRARVEQGFLVAQRRCSRCRSGFKRLWRTRLPAGAAVPPVVTDRSIHAGLLDNRVYAFRRRNGHRIWDAGVGARVLLPPARDAAGRILVPVAPGGAATLLALDPRTGAILARLALPDDATPVGGPRPLPGGAGIAWAFEEYDPTKARLWRIEVGPERRAPPAESGTAGAG